MRELKVEELYQLQEELVGKNGILLTEMPLLTKFKFNEIVRQIKGPLETAEKLREELVKKYGEENEDGAYKLDYWYDEEKQIVNDSFIKYSEEFSKVLKEKADIKLNTLSPVLLKGITTTNYYPVLFELFEEKTKE